MLGANSITRFLLQEETGMNNDIPSVRDCEALHCRYNSSWRCSADTVTVGRQNAAYCNTFMTSETTGTGVQGIAKVTDCEIHMCLRNKDLKCGAYAIKVRIQDSQPRCVSFKNRYK